MSTHTHDVTLSEYLIIYFYAEGFIINIMIPFNMICRNSFRLAYAFASSHSSYRDLFLFKITHRHTTQHGEELGTWETEKKDHR